MGYADQITILKNSLNQYQTEEQKLSQLYKTAKENAEKNNKEAIKQLNEDYYHSRNEAYTDNARSERNLNNQLSARGLGFSGEAAQAKLNSNLNLSNRLGELNREKSTAQREYNLKLADTLSQLSIEEADKLQELLKNKNQVNLEIADLELEKEKSDADRVANQQIEANKLEFSINELNARIQLEKEKLNAEKDMLDSKIKAEREDLITKLEAEKEMARAELKAKYGYDYGGNGNGENGGEGEDVKGYIPDVDPEALAKQVTGGKRISGEDDEYAISKFLLSLNTNYQLDEDYYDQLVLMLESYGYSPMTVPEMRTSVITYEAQAYNSDEEFDRLYNSYVVKGETPYQAKTRARADIAKKQMDFIYQSVKNDTEFRICCIALGIGTATYQDYLDKRGK